MVARMLKLVPKRRRSGSGGGGQTLFIRVFSVLLVATAGTAFVFKLIEFFFTATKSGTDALASFLIPVMNYLLVAAGFGCLLVWAVVRGHYKDVEAPKHRMLELNRLADLEDAKP